MGTPLHFRRAHRLPPECYATPGAIFSVTVATRPRAPVFLDRSFAARACELLIDLCAHTETLLYGYCLMPDHVHMVVGVGRRSLSEFVGSWKSLVDAERRRRGRFRPMWQRGFFDAGLRSERVALEATRYVLDNPMRAGIVSCWREYPFSGSRVWEL